MLRLLYKISPSTANSVGGCLFYVIGLPLLVIFVLGFALIALSPSLGLRTGSPEIQLAFGVIVVIAFVIDVLAFLAARSRRRSEAAGDTADEYDVP